MTLPLHLARLPQDPAHIDDTLNSIRNTGFGARDPHARLSTPDVNRGMHPNRETGAYRANHTQSN
jgi:hypothetical protein